MRLSVRTFWPALALALSVFQVSAQTFSNCNPLYNSGCPADPALGKSASYDFAGGASSDFTPSQNPNYDSNGAGFTVAQRGNSPTLTSEWYIMFGHVEWVVKAAPGTGIVSSAVLISDCLDEIDWEWLGGDNDQVQSNYFGKGITTAYNRGAFHGATNNHDQFHTYTIDWTADQIVWQVDGVTVRVQTAASADAGQYPQTPMQVRMGVWAGGDPSNPPGTISWAGGQTDYSAGPFTMYVKSLKVTDYSTGSQYTYSGSAGTWQSINSQGGTVNSQGDGTPVSSADAPAITSVVSGSAPLAFDPSDSASAAATRTGWPWVLDSATVSAVTAISSVYTSIAGLPSGWTVSDSGKTPSPSTSLSPASSSASQLASGLEIRTTFNDQGFPTTITYDPATATIPVSYDSQGFPITNLPPLPTTGATNSANTAASVPPSATTPTSGPQTSLVSSDTVANSSRSNRPPASSDASNGLSSAAASSSGGTAPLSSTPATLRTSSRRATVTSFESARTTATATASGTPAAPNANEAVGKGLGLVALVGLGALVVV